MRKGDFFQWILIPLCLICSLASSSDLQAQDEVKNYVVIGAFEFEENAKEWVSFAQDKNLDAQHQMNYNRGLYYVYCFSSDNWEETVAKLNKVWQMKFFKDSWVYTGNFGQSNESIVKSVAEEPLEVKDTEEKVMSELKEKEDTKKRQEEEKVLAEEELEIEVKSEPIEQQGQKTSLTREELREEVILKEDEQLNNAGNEKVTLGDYLVFFNLFNAQNINDVNGEVQVIDTERAKLMQTVKSGEYISIMDPKNGTGRISLIVETFGYRKSQHEINYDTPLADTNSIDIDLIGDIMVYHFPLVRYHKGDIATMYNVYFFKDAAIMRPESKYEVKSLLEMMKENPKYKIKIHGHVNGKSPGPIITAGGDNEWFALTDDDESGFGSAKKLSKERALVIKNYLVDRGIDPKRMEIKAWGGKRMLYDKHSSQAYKNVRVEIEILEE